MERSAALAWVLLRAFGARDGGLVTRCVDGAGACLRAERLDLAARIATRQSTMLLEREVGRVALRRMMQHRLASVGVDRALRRPLARVDAACSRLGVEAILLKHAALCAGGYIENGSRHARDIDVMVEESSAPLVLRALCAAGFGSAGDPPQPHHLPPVYDEAGVGVEIHVEVPLLASGGGALTAERLLQLELVRRAPGTQRCWFPTRPVLAAHAMVHGYVQHGATPSAYPMARMLADLADLYPPAEQGGGTGDFREIEEFVRPAMSHGEVQAMMELVGRLSRGELPASETHAEHILRHVCSASLDDDYRRALELRRLRQALTSRSPWRRGPGRAGRVRDVLRRPWRGWLVGLVGVVEAVRAARRLRRRAG